MKTLQNDQKNFGRYYTPDYVAYVLSKWGITSKESKVFDSSFGCCALLYESMKVLSELGAKKPGRFLFGVDIDPNSEQYLKPIFEKGGRKENFIIDDFFNIRPKDFSPDIPFDVIIGNPPYIRSLLLSKKLKHTANEAISELDIKIHGFSSYWVHFIIHSMRFLGTDGKMAMILPYSFINSDYSKFVHEYLKNSFSEIMVLKFLEMIFPDAQEGTILFLAKGFQKGPGTIRYQILKKVFRFEEFPNIYTTAKTLKDTKFLRSEFIPQIIGSEPQRIYENLLQHENVRLIGDLAKIRIGAVTGGNNFFLLNEQQKNKLKLPEDFVIPVVSKASQLSGLEFKKSDFEKNRFQGSKCFILNPKNSNQSPELEEYLLQGISSEIKKRYHCRNRDPWYVVLRTYTPDCFMQYMSNIIPRIILNSSKATSTNNIHRLIFQKDFSSHEKRFISLSSITSFTQLSTQLEGRHYAGGLLKLEPSDVSRIKIVFLKNPTTIKSAFSEADTLLRDKRYLEAIKIADETIFEELLDFKQKDLQILQNAWAKLLHLKSY